MGFPGGTSGKQLTCKCRRCKRWWFDPWIRKIPWRRKWQPTPVFLPGEAHSQRSLEACKVSKRWTWLKQLSMPAHRGQIPWRRTHRTQGWERSLGWLIKSRDEAAISLWRAGLDQESGPDYLPCCLWSSVQMRAPNSLTPLTQENLCPTPWWGCGGWWGRRVELCLAARLSW